MAHWMDIVLIVLCVLVSAAYAFYTFSSVRLKRVVLSLLVRCFGVRVFSVFSPQLTGCSGCSGGAQRKDALTKQLPKSQH